MDGDAMSEANGQPITMEWLESRGAKYQPCGERIKTYDVAPGVSVQFVDRRLYEVRVNGYRWPIATRQDLCDLLRLMGAPPLKVQWQ